MSKSLKILSNLNISFLEVKLIQTFYLVHDQFSIFAINQSIHPPGIIVYLTGKRYHHNSSQMLIQFIRRYHHTWSHFIYLSPTCRIQIHPIHTILLYLYHGKVSSSSITSGISSLSSPFLWHSLAASAHPCLGLGSITILLSCTKIFTADFAFSLSSLSISAGIMSPLLFPILITVVSITHICYNILLKFAANIVVYVITSKYFLNILLNNQDNRPPLHGKKR